MSKRHHIGEEWLLDYAAGTLSDGEAMVVATQALLVPEVSKALSMADNFGASFFADVDEAVPASTDIDNLLESLPDQDRPAEEPVELPWDEIPEVLSKFLNQNDKALKWSFLAPGLKKMKVWESDDGQRLWLLKAKPGVEIPTHGHSGTELTLVLKGAFIDDGITYRAGDVEECSEDYEHSITIADGEECICLALTQGPLKFENPLIRALQPLTGL